MSSSSQLVPFKWIVFLILLVGGYLAKAEALRTYTESVEKNISLKEQVPITVVYPKGKVSVQGWIQDRVRVTLKKRVIAASEEIAQQSFKNKDLHAIQTPKSLELRLSTARGQDLLSKLKAEKDDSVSIDLEIKAPYSSQITLLGGSQQEYEVTEWRGDLSIQAKDSQVSLQQSTLKGKLQISCPGCEIDISESRFMGHIYATTKPIRLHQVNAFSLSIETTSGDVELNQVTGDTTLTTDSGRIYLKKYTGMQRTQSKSGAIFANDFTGGAQWNTESGQVIAQVNQLEQNLNIESDQGEVQLTLPTTFSGMLDLLSLKDDVIVKFPHEPILQQKKEIYGPTEPGLVYSRVGQNLRPVVKIRTKTSGIRVSRESVRNDE